MKIIPTPRTHGGVLSVDRATYRNRARIHGEHRNRRTGAETAASGSTNQPKYTMTEDNGTDWRESAYLQRSRWPEAIPNCGPKREYGPRPWSEPTHDPHDVDPYPASHPNAASVGHDYRGDVCPWCGVPLSGYDEVYLIDGERGEFYEIDGTADPTPAYHPECWRKRRAEMAGLENKTLDDYL